MKILMLTPYLPYPLLSGGQIRTYNLLKNLSQHHDITLFALIKSEEERRHIQPLKPFCRHIQVFKRTQNPWALRNILLAGFTAYPFLVTRNLPRGMKAAIKTELQNQNYDLIHAETFYMMPNIPTTKIPILLVEQTIEYLGYQYYAQTTKHWFLKPLLYIDIAKIKFWEKHFWRKATHLVTMSQDDKKFIQSQMGESANIDVVANGVDADRFAQTKRLNPAHPTVLFVGTFKWLPNIDAVEYIAQEIWPAVKAKIPDAKLWIVGHSPTETVKEFAKKPDVTVSSGIEDIRDAYGGAHVLLAPIRSGKGTKYKVLEAMATGTPVVTTSLGAEGLKLKSGKQVLIGNTTQELVNHTVKLLGDAKLQKSLAKQAKNFVSTHFDWKTISKDLDILYRQLGKSKENQVKSIKEIQ